MQQPSAISKRIVLIQIQSLTDPIGLPLKNRKIMADDLGKRLELYVWIPDYFAGKRWCEFFVMRLGQAICQFINFQEIREDWSS